MGAASQGVTGFWRTRPKKTSHGPRGARRLGESGVNFEEADLSKPEQEVGRQSTEVAHEADREEEDGAPAFGVAAQSLPSGRGAIGRVFESSPAGDAAGSQAGPPHRQGKEPISDEGARFIPTGWPSPYYMAEIEEGAWNEVSNLMIGTLPPVGRLEGEPDLKHRFEPVQHLDARSYVLKSKYMQARAVEQYKLPEDEEYLKTISDTGLHVILRSYLTRGCLVEQELYS